MAPRPALGGQGENPSPVEALEAAAETRLGRIGPGERHLLGVRRRELASLATAGAVGLGSWC